MDFVQSPNHHQAGLCRSQPLLGWEILTAGHVAAYILVLNVGLLGVAGMMKLLVMKWIIPENSLRKTHQCGPKPIDSLHLR